MNKQIILLRGINVGGHNKLPMADFKQILANLGGNDIQTYIQSGNAVLKGDLEAGPIAEAIEASKGFKPSVMIINQSDFENVKNANPFKNGEEDGKTLHVWFLGGPPSFDTEEADALRSETEQYHVANTAIYLHAPDGIGRSKLAERMERLSGTKATARNWNTIAKLSQLCAALS